MAQGVWLNNNLNTHTITWGTLRENLDKLEKDCSHKGIYLMPTWRYHHSSFPETKVYKPLADLISLPTGYKFNLDFTQEQAEQVKHIMKELPMVQNLQVNPCYRLSWASYSHDKMISYDVTVHAMSLQDACNTANRYWMNFRDLAPLMGYVNMMNMDDVETIFLEFTHSGALRALQVQGAVSWVLLVAPRIASVSWLPHPANMEALDKVVRELEAYNQTNRGTRVSQGGLFIDRMILGKPWQLQADVKAKLGDGRVYWDRFWGHQTLSGQQGPSRLVKRETKTDLEVLATLAGFQYQQNKDFYLAMLKGTITDWLLAKLPKNLQDTRPSFTWSTTGTPTVFKVICNTKDLAKHLCLTVVDLEVQQEGNLASIGFKSSKHTHKKSDWEKHFSQFMIQDASTEFSGEHAGSTWEEVPLQGPSSSAGDQ